MRYLILAAIAAASCHATYLTASDLRFERVYETVTLFSGPEQMYRDWIYGTAVNTSSVPLLTRSDAYMDIPGLWWFPGLFPHQTYSGLLAITEYIPLGLPTTGVTEYFSSFQGIPGPIIFDELVLRRPASSYGGRPSSAPTAVPEPASLILTLTALLALCLRRPTDRHLAA